MTRLRRDLVERRLWIVIAALVLAVAAVPFVLHGHSEASADVVAPPTTGSGGMSAVASAGSGSAQATSDDAARRKGGASAAVRHAETTRDPFAAETSTSSSTTTTATTTSASATRTTSATAASAGSTTASTTSSESTGYEPAATGGATAPVATDPASSGVTGVVTKTVTVPAPATPTTTSTATTATTPTPAGDGPWTVYAVSAAVGATDHVTARANLPRLTPLPSTRSPKVMFTGVLDHGHDAVFALGDGVQATGPGQCRPSRADCPAITLGSGQVEQLSWFAPDGATVTEYLADHITAVKVVSRAAVQTAFARFSRAGQCELDLADPLAYDETHGTVSESVKPACRGVHHAVPFPGSPNGS